MINYLYQKSNKTDSQTRGLSNLEMKHFGKLAIIGASLKGAKTSCVRIKQGHAYLTKRRLFCWLIAIARVVELQLNME